MVKLTGSVPKLKRVKTGLYSFDHSFINRKGEVGLPIHGIELYGPSHCGKSTVCQSISGIVAKELNGDIAFVDFEGCDAELLESIMDTQEYEGDVHFVLEETDEDTLGALVALLRDENYVLGILDSIGAVSPISEQQGSIGEANMGRRALAMAQFSRKMLKVLRDNENKCIFSINHAYPKIGGLGKETPGGRVKDYLFSNRIEMKRRYVKSGWQEYPDGSYVIEGKVVKNRWGLRLLPFLLFVLSGKGVHRGMTTMFDCIEEGLATSKNVVKIGDKSYGRLKPIIDKAQEGDEEFFQPFYDLLKGDNENDKPKSDE